MTPHAPQNNGWMDPDPKGMWFHAGEVEALEAGLAKLEAENDTATHQIESLANQCQFQAERLVTLDAENAELRQEIVYWKKSCIGNSADLAAANATLDRLREVVPSREHWMHCCQCGMIMTPRPTLDIQECPNCFAMLQEIPGKLIAILYPTPENDNDSTS